jgi:hypothetical protein
MIENGAVANGCMRGVHDGLCKVVVDVNILTLVAGIRPLIILAE